jgi:AraC-like DNA-binding protein
VAKHKRREREVRRRVLLLDAPGLEPLVRLSAPYEAQAYSWDALIETVALAPPSSVVLLDPLNPAEETGLDPRVKEVVTASRAVPVVALVPFDARGARRARTLLEWGVTELADAELEGTPETLHPRLLAVHAQPLKRALEPYLSRFISTNGLTLIRAAAEVAVDGGTLRDFARIFDSSERTITTWCTREALPPPRRLLAWLRLFLALTLLEERQRSVMNAAMSAGYLDYSLRRAIRQFLGDEGTVRDRSLKDAVGVFNTELRELREVVRAQRRAERAA